MTIAWAWDKEEEYIEKVELAIEQGITNVCRSLSRVCFDCDIDPKELDRESEWAKAHRMIGPWVIIACEGYAQIDPNLVGIESPNWSHSGQRLYEGEHG